MIAILIGAIVLLWFEVIDLRIPGSYILSFAVCTLLFGGHGLDFGFLLAELCGGGLMLGAFFMATDYVTSPITKSGQIVYGIALGILTAISGISEARRRAFPMRLSSETFWCLSLRK